MTSPTVKTRILIFANFKLAKIGSVSPTLPITPKTNIEGKKKYC